MQTARFFLLLVALALTSPSICASAESGDDVESKAIAQLIAKVRPSVVTIRVTGRDGGELAMGTGFVIDPQGLIATNLHVIGEGRPFSVEMPGGRKLSVIAVESSDRTADLAILRVDFGNDPLPALPTAVDPLVQGTQVLAFGNPLGLRDSVVAGIVSAVREVQGREMIQLAMPVQPGNSGGPLVDRNGQVLGVINMKSAIDDNLGFAIPIDQLAPLREQPNPVNYQRWVTLGTIDPQAWSPLFGADWQQRGGIISARGSGNGFGGRSLCLWTSATPESPVEIAVDVRLDSESGAAGLAFHADGQDRHYGFYPSNGRMRLTCFNGPTVYEWEVLAEVPTEHYLPGQWNRLRVHIDNDRLQCFVNGHLVIESQDRQLTGGRAGLAKFRDTNPDFRRFRIGQDLESEQLSEETRVALDQALKSPTNLGVLTDETMHRLGESSVGVARELERQATAMENQARQLRRLAADVTLVPSLQQLEQVIADDSDNERLLRGALLIASLDHPELDVESYMSRVDAMAQEIQAKLSPDADATDRRKALHTYLFDENGFHGGRAEYDHPANSHLDRVIDDREGLPITLSILYIELARRIGMEVEGVGLPGHFIVRQIVDEHTRLLIDVFDRGTLLSDSDAKHLVRDFTGREVNDQDVRAQSVEEILARVLNNLLGVAGRDSDHEAIRRYCEAMVAIQPDSAEAIPGASPDKASRRGDRGLGLVDRTRAARFRRAAGSAITRIAVQSADKRVMRTFIGRAERRQARDEKASGGHGTRTRNPLRGN